MNDDKRKPSLGLDMSFSEATKRLAKTNPEEIVSNKPKISTLSPKTGAKEIGGGQGELDLQVEKDFDGIGMGVLSDGTLT